MVNKQSRSEVRVKKHNRMRNRFAGTAERPRLAVFRSNNHMYVQIIDDVAKTTLVSASTLQKDCLSGIAAMTFPGAKKEGLLYMFTSKAHERTVKTALFLQTAAVAVLMLYLDGVTGVAVLVGAGLTFLYYYKKCKKELGGITGDTEGYFVTVCECVIVVAAAVCEIIR